METTEDLVRRLKRLELVHTVSRQLNDTMDGETLLPRVLRLVLDAVGAEAGSLWLLRGDKIVCEHAAGGAGDAILGMELPRGAGVVGNVAERRRPEIVLDAEQDRRHLRQVDDATGFQVRSMITVPLLVRGESLGALQVLNKREEGKRFTPEDAELVREIAVDAASVVRNARLLQTERRAREMRALLQMSREITSTLDLDRILTTAVNILSGIVAFDRCSLALQRDGGLEIVALSGKEAVDRTDPGVKAAEDLARWIGAFQYTIYSPSPDSLEEQDPDKVERLRAHAEATGMKAVLAVPLKDDSGFIGVLAMEAATEDFLEEGQQELVETYTNQVAVALRNADLYRQTPLVGLLQRRKGGGGIGGGGRGGAWSRPWVRRGTWVAAAALVLVLVPVPRWARGDAVVIPSRRHLLRAEGAQVVESVAAEEGEAVRKGQVLGELRKEELRAELAGLAAEIRTSRAAAARHETAGELGEARAARERLEWLEIRRDLLEERLEASTLRSPVDGFLLTHRPRDLVGTTTEPGATVLEVAEAGRWFVEILVPQESLPGVEAGRTASFVTPALPGREFGGTVVTVGALGEAEGEETVFPVAVEVEDAGGLLRSGMRGRAYVRLGRQSLGGRLFGGLLRWLRWQTGW